MCYLYFHPFDLGVLIPSDVLNKLHVATADSEHDGVVFYNCIYYLGTGKVAVFRDKDDWYKHIVFLDQISDHFIYTIASLHLVLDL